MSAGGGEDKGAGVFEEIPVFASVRWVGASLVVERTILQERCLLYVAATRARDALRITWSGEPSPFLKPLLVS